MAVTQDWFADVRRYSAGADPDVVAGVVRHCGISLRNRDSSLVSFSDPGELGRVRDRFLKKKLGLEHADDVLDRAIASVGEKMKNDRTKNRVTVYYLLAEHYDRLSLFVSAAAKKAREGKMPTVDMVDAEVAEEETSAQDTGSLSTSGFGRRQSSPGVKVQALVGEPIPASGTGEAEPMPQPAREPEVVAASSSAPAVSVMDQDRTSVVTPSAEGRMERRYAAYGDTDEGSGSATSLARAESAQERGGAWPWWGWVLAALIGLMLLAWLLS